MEPVFIAAFIAVALLLLFIWNPMSESFADRAKVITDKFGHRMVQGPPVRYQEFKAAISDGDPVEFNAVRHLTNKRSADPYELSTLL